MYKEKYLKYKTKYLELKNQIGSYPNIIQDGGGLYDLLFGVNVVIELIDYDINKSIKITNAFEDKKITSLTIDNSREISTDEFTALVTGLKKNKTLKKLKIISTKLTDVQYTELGDALGKNDGLTSLLIELITDNNMYVIPLQLIEALGTNKKLQYVYFMNILDNNGIETLKNALEQNQNQKIKTLFFKNNSNVYNKKLHTNIEMLYTLMGDKNIGFNNDLKDLKGLDVKL
jgi:hypothetical protein